MDGLLQTIEFYGGLALITILWLTLAVMDFISTRVAGRRREGER